MTAIHFIVPGRLDRVTGGSRYAARMVRELRQSGRTITVAELPGRFPVPDAVSRRATARALRLAPANAAVVVDGLCLAALFEGHGPTRRYIVLLHHPSARETGLMADQHRRLDASERTGLAAATAVIATSHHSAGVLVSDFGVRSDRLAVVRPGAERTSIAHGAGADAPLNLLYVATLTPRKAHDVLIDALEQLVDCNWRLRCWGPEYVDAAWVARLRSRLSSGGIGQRIELCGEGTDKQIADAYICADLYVHASYYEGYGMAVADALAYGLPVVATAGGAVDEVVPVAAGMLVPPGAAAALGAAVADMIADPARRALCSAAALRAARARADWPAAAASFAAAVDALTR